MTKRVVDPLHKHDFTKHSLHRDQDRCKHCGMLRLDIMGPFAHRKARMRLAYEDMETRLNRR